MYIPSHFEQHDPQALHSLIRDYPLATLIASTDSGLSANHLPLVIEENETDGLQLLGHVARANPLCEAQVQDSVLAVFQGPNAYISPNWYATKQQHGKVVPTWNYSAVHATGTLRLIDDRDWTRAIVERLTDQEEAGQPVPWAVADAPASFIEGLLTSIVGIELSVTDLCGKWKVSQNQPEENRNGVQAGLTTLSNPAADQLSGFQT